MNYYVVATLFVSIVLSFFLYRFFLEKSKKYTLKKANNSGERWASQAKPVSGGIAFFTIFILSAIANVLFFDKEYIIDAKSIGVAIVISISFFMGLADDILNTTPYFKLFVQILSAIILINFGIYIEISPYNYINYIATALWVIAIMNSINMLDNMDSITTLVSLSILFGVIANMILSEVSLGGSFVLITIVSIGALLSFLIYNWSPSKMYMGDSGSQYLGSLLAVLGIVYFWNINTDPTFGYNTKQLMIVILAFLVPIVDTTTVTINRLLKKQSPFVGGRDHTTHFLSYLGFSDRKVAIILFIISLISVGLSVYITNFVDDWNIIHIICFGSFALIVFLALYINTKITKSK